MITPADLPKTYLAQFYVEGMTQKKFAADTRTQQAVIMNLVIIGEPGLRWRRVILNQ